MQSILPITLLYHQVFLISLTLFQSKDCITVFRYLNIYFKIYNSLALWCIYGTFFWQNLVWLLFFLDEFFCKFYDLTLSLIINSQPLSQRRGYIDISFNYINFLSVMDHLWYFTGPRGSSILNPLHLQRNHQLVYFSCSLQYSTSSPAYIGGSYMHGTWDGVSCLRCECWPTCASLWWGRGQWDKQCPGSGRLKWEEETELTWKHVKWINKKDP